MTLNALKKQPKKLQYVTESASAKWILANTCILHAMMVVKAVYVKIGNRAVVGIPSGRGSVKRGIVHNSSA